jgi:hypothetical protein
MYIQTEIELKRYRQIYMHTHTHMEYYSDTKVSEILSFGVTWIEM